LDADNNAKSIVLDADSLHRRDKLFDLAQDLREEAIPCYIEDSRRGCHLWFFFDESIPGKMARAFGNQVLENPGIVNIELFPKQDRLVTGPGSPMGLH
jgi:hypothetical protein